MYIIIDWAGNVLNYKGYFQPKQLSVPMEFTCFDDGWSWIYENVDDSDGAYDDIEVLKKVG